MNLDAWAEMGTVDTAPQAASDQYHEHGLTGRVRFVGPASLLLIQPRAASPTWLDAEPQQRSDSTALP